MERSARKPSISRRLAVAWLLVAVPAHAADLQSRVDDFVGTASKARLDPRTLRDCATPPVIDWYGAMRRAVLVACPGTPGWRVFVPVKAVPGAAAPNPFLAAPVIKRGDPVQIHAGGPGFQVTSMGSAEQDGRVGGRIRVRNAGTGTVTPAIVESAGNVSLPGYNSGPVGR